MQITLEHKYKSKWYNITGIKYATVELAMKDLQALMNHGSYDNYRVIITAR